MSQAPAYDVIVVGAGTAGSVLAGRLSEDENARVLLLEAGSGTPQPASAHPPEWQTLVRGPSDGGGLTTVQAATGKPVHLARGRGIGGSSAINAMMFARGYRDSYADWPDGWQFDDLLPYFQRSENAPHGDPALRGADGPMLVAPATPPNPVLVSALCAAQQRGYNLANDISSGSEIGFGPADLTIANGIRQTAADAYLRPALGRPNLDVITEAVVHRVLVRDGRCTGVEYRTVTGQSTTVATAGEVVLSAGAIGSPQLLMLSGIGPQTHLRDVGVDVVLDLPGVGANLQDHPLTGVIYQAAQQIPAPQNNHGEMMGLIRSTSSSGGAPDLQILMVDTSAVAGVHLPNSYLLGSSAMHPFSRGTVRLAGPAADRAPVVDPNYLSDDRDMKTLLEGLSIARDIGTAPALDSWRGEEMAPGPQINDENSLRAYVRETVSSYFHPAGTCAMGETECSVVDVDLRVRGMTGLRVVDASVMPSLPSNNPLATVYGIAERAAELIRRT